MYERFTDRARKVMQLANEEARRLNNEYIGTDHILLGIAKLGNGVAVHVLGNLGVEPQTIITEVEKYVLSMDFADRIGKLPQTPRAKKVIEYAMLEARDLKHEHVGTEHILMGLLREDEAFAAQLLMNLGLRLDRVRAEVLSVLGSTCAVKTTTSSESPIPLSNDDSPSRVRELDEDTKRRVRELADEIAPLQREVENAVACQEFSKAARLRDRREKLWKELSNLNLPECVVRNVQRLVNAWPSRVSRLPLLEMLDDETGEADAEVLSVLPNPLVPPVRIVIGCVPRYPLSTLRTALAPNDICSPFFQALVPLLSPESVAHRKGNHAEMTQCVFLEVSRAQNPTRGRAVLLCVVCLGRLAQDVRREVFAGLHQTNCDFVVFEPANEAQSLLEHLPPGTQLLKL